MRTKMICARVLFFVGSAMTLIPEAAHADITLRNVDGTQSVVYREATNARHRVCAPNTVTASRNCENPQGEQVLGITVYTEALQKSLKIDNEEFRGIDGLAKIQEEIRFTEPLASDPSLSPEELGRAQGRLIHLKDIELKLLKVDTVLRFMEQGKEITYGAAFSELFETIKKPFSNLTSTLPKVVRYDRIGGTIWTKLSIAMPYWDAADIRHPNGWNQKGCKRSLGPAWNLATSEQLRVAGIEDCTWTKNGEVEAYSKYLSGITLCWRGKDLEELIRFGVPYEKDFPARVLCVAKASQVDPAGDIDEDGIINSEDQCNGQPENLAAPVHTSGRFKGCAAGQIPEQNN